MNLCITDSTWFWFATKEQSVWVESNPNIKLRIVIWGMFHLHCISAPPYPRSPPKDSWNPNLPFCVHVRWKINSEEFFFFGTIEKLSEGSKFCKLVGRKNPNPSFKKATVLRRGPVWSLKSNDMCLWSPPKQPLVEIWKNGKIII